MFSLLKIGDNWFTLYILDFSSGNNKIEVRTQFLIMYYCVIEICRTE